MSFTSPAPNSQKGRLDAGVDYSNIRGSIVAVAGGTITNVYQSLRGFAYTIIEKVQGGPSVYYGLETGGAPVGIQPGQRVTQGQRIARGLGTGGIEVGYWNPATGRPVGQYSEGGGPTLAAKQFDAQIGGGTSSLEQLWIQAGGPPGVAQTMAAIALAESGGNESTPPSKNSDGSTDFGLWRINSSHTQFDTTRLQNDPAYNAQAAVAIYRSQGLQAWTTYNTGAFRQFLGQAASASVNYGGPGGGMVRPGGGSPSGSGGGVAQSLQNYIDLRDTPRTPAPQTKNPALWWWASFTDNWQKVGSGS